MALPPNLGHGSGDAGRYRQLSRDDPSVRVNGFTRGQDLSAYFSHDTTVLWGSQYPRQLVEDCYTPNHWDSLSDNSPDEKCRVFLFSNHGPHETRAWITAILKHPISYAEHRIAHFNGNHSDYYKWCALYPRIRRLYCCPDRQSQNSQWPEIVRCAHAYSLIQAITA
jgi:hypothetical protein